MTNRLIYTIENGGVVIPIENATPRGFVKLAGRTGFGVAPTTLVMTEGATEGAKWRRTRRGTRTIDLPLAYFGATRDEVETKLRLLIRTLGDKKRPARLVALYPNGRRVYAQVHYSGGLNPQYGQNADTDGQEFVKFVLTLVAPSPYWTEETPVAYAVKAPNQGRGLLPSLSKLQVSSSQALGTLEVNNPGDVAARPVWAVRGPGSSLMVSNGGLAFTYDYPIALDEVVTINTVTNKVTSSVDGNVYARLAPAPKLFNIPAGMSVIDVLVPDSTAATIVNMYFNPRRELVY